MVCLGLDENAPFQEEIKRTLFFFRAAGNIYNDGIFTTGHVKTVMLKILDKSMTKNSTDTYTLVQRVACPLQMKLPFILRSI